MIQAPLSRVLAVCLAVSLATPLPVGAQELPTPKPVDSARAEVTDWLDLLRFFDADDTKIEFERDGSHLGVLLLGNAQVRTAQFELWADGIGLSRSGTAADPSYRLVAVGNVLLVHAEQSFRAETLFYDHARRRAAMTDVRARADVEFLRRPPGFAGELAGDARDRRAALLDELALPADDETTGEAGALRGGSDLGTMPAAGPPGKSRPHPTGRLVVAARELEVEDFERFRGHGIQVTTCDFGKPHWALEAKRFTVDRVVEPPAAGATDPRPGVHYEAKLSATHARLGDVSIPFLPSLAWDTRWNDSIPLRSVSYSNSSNFGQRVDTLWRADLLLPRSIRSWLDLGLRLDYLSKRGTGYGAEARWGERPSRWSRMPGEGPLGGIDVYGVGTYYAIEDRGEDANDLVPEHRGRSRARIHQRARLAWGTLIDAEYAVEREGNFLEEYFESELRGEKEPENLIYVRQPVSELAAFTALAKVQQVPFRGGVERTPEISFFWVEQPIANTGIDLDVTARAADLRFQPANTDSLPSRRLNRGDIRATVARAMGNTRWVKVRPFFETRYTLWEEDELRRNSIEQIALATGATARGHLARTFHPGWGPYSALRHTIDPEVRYRVLFEDNVDQREVFRFDGTEEVRRFESLTFTLRSFLFGRRPSGAIDAEAVSTDDSTPEGSGGLEGVDRRDALGDFAGAARARRPRPPGSAIVQQRLVEGELSVDYFPDPTRDNAGDLWGPIRGELLLEPVPWIGYFVEGRYDAVGKPRFVQFDHGLQLRHGTAAAGVGTRYRQHQGHSITGSWQWFASEKYEFDAFYSYDLRREDDIDQYYSVVRNFHRWAVMFTLEIDAGEDDNVSFFVRCGPRELWQAIRGN